MIATSIRKGNVIIFRDELHVVIDQFHGTPGKGPGFMQLTMKNIKTGRKVQNKFASNENVERVTLDSRKCQYLYKDEMGYHFMDMDTYDSFQLGEDMIGDAKFYLLDNMELVIQFHGETPVLPEFPKSVILTVTESAPGIKGDSVSNNTKPATCETGLNLQVPMFVEEGTKIKVNTETGEYLGRA